jgi:2-C-methyl-D-erythritol 2,4-cyclodiphosphate synthase
VGIRIGVGYDVHPFVGGRPLHLGGVRVEHSAGLAGHSDADAVAHAICDALLGAMALGDLGHHFPDTDPQWLGADSAKLLGKVVDMLAERDARPSNVDVTVIAEEPRLAPYFEAMRTSLAQTLRIDRGRVSVKATRPEKLGALGRREGLAAMAVALVETTENP